MKQLKPGDKVLVDGEVCSILVHFQTSSWSEGYVLLDDGEGTWVYERDFEVLTELPEINEERKRTGISGG